MAKLMTRISLRDRLSTVGYLVTGKNSMRFRKRERFCIKPERVRQRVIKDQQARLVHQHRTRAHKEQFRQARIRVIPAPSGLNCRVGCGARTHATAVNVKGGERKRYWNMGKFNFSFRSKFLRVRL